MSHITSNEYVTYHRRGYTRLKYHLYTCNIHEFILIIPSTRYNSKRDSSDLATFSSHPYFIGGFDGPKQDLEFCVVQSTTVQQWAFSSERPYQWWSVSVLTFVDAPVLKSDILSYCCTSVSFCWWYRYFFHCFDVGDLMLHEIPDFPGTEIFSFSFSCSYFFIIGPFACWYLLMPHQWNPRQFGELLRVCFV